jgi:tetratricopeptide (TPR) repeat protein
MRVIEPKGRSGVPFAGYRTATRLARALAQLYCDRAGRLADSGKLDAAEHDAIAGLRLNPDNPRLYTVLGQIRAERADYRGAFAAFDHALALDPDLVAALSGRAATAYRVDDCARALSDLERAIELSPDNPALRFTRALVLQETGRWDEALVELDAVASLASVAGVNCRAVH